VIIVLALVVGALVKHHRDASQIHALPTPPPAEPSPTPQSDQSGNQRELLFFATKTRFGS
jgi:hypothetical protein